MTRAARGVPASDVHRPGVALGAPKQVRKVVVKVRVSLLAEPDLATIRWGISLRPVAFESPFYKANNSQLWR
jgi:hypothetical protein